MAKKRSDRTQGHDQHSEEARKLQSLLSEAIDTDDVAEFLAHVVDENEIDFGDDQDGELPYPVFDRPMMETLLRNLPSGEISQSDLDRASELMDQLGDEFDPVQQLALAQNALKSSPNCADAWNYLADCADSPEHALELFQRAWQAGRQTVGDRFEDLRGEFEDAAETQSLMRSLEGQADLLQLMRRNEEAITIYQEMLELSPCDTRSVRWRLLGLLLLVNRIDEAVDLIDDYPDESYALWPYARLLLAIRVGRPDAELHKLLAAAHLANEHLLPYLIGDRRMDGTPPEFFSIGDASEALVVIPELLPVWRTTPGATAWLRRAIATQGIEFDSESDSGAGITESLLAEALEVPQQPNQVWQLDYRKGKSHDEVYWGIMIADPQEHLARHEVVLTSKPTPDDVFDSILEAIVQPDLADPGRPGEIHFSKKSLCKHLAARLDELAISCRVKQLDELDQIFDFVVQMAEAEVDPLAEDPASLAAIPGRVWQVTAVQVLDTIEEQGERFRPWLAVVFEPETGLVLQIDVNSTPHNADELREVICKAIFCSPYGEPTKPEEIQVRSNDELLAIEPLLAPWGIRCRLGKSFAEFDESIEEMQSRFASRRMPALAEVAEITPRDLCYFYEAAASFYKTAPWVRTRADSVLQFNSTEFEHPLYAVIMGQLGSVVGLAVFLELDHIQQLLADAGSGNLTQIHDSWSVMFGEPDDISPRDSDAIEVHGWPIAAPEAFPLLVKVVGGRPVVPTVPREVRWMGQCLATLARASFPVTAPQTIRIPMVETESGEIPHADVVLKLIVG